VLDHSAGLEDKLLQHGFDAPELGRVAHRSFLAIECILTDLAQVVHHHTAMEQIKKLVSNLPLGKCSKSMPVLVQMNHF
jgi:hypothetical protein